MTRYLLATRSGGKLRELEPLFAAAGFDVRSLAAAGVPEGEDELAIEQYLTFEENAVAKARYFHELTGLPTFADDSGIAVHALGGRPGVHSKRWSGRTDLSGQALDDANNATLLSALRGVDDRRARYVCAAALVADGKEVVRRGEVAGCILQAPRGEGGFGYDPLFLAEELGRTFGEATLEDKLAISHRGRAFRALLGALAHVDSTFGQD
jgi:XTP/dITP diphosphohydrolase